MNALRFNCYTFLFRSFSLIFFPFLSISPLSLCLPLSEEHFFCWLSLKLLDECCNKFSAEPMKEENLILRRSERERTWMKNGRREFFNLIISRQFGKTYSLLLRLTPPLPPSEKAVLFSIIFQDRKTPSLLLPRVSSSFDSVARLYKDHFDSFDLIYFRRELLRRKWSFPVQLSATFPNK